MKVIKGAYYIEYNYIECNRNSSFSKDISAKAFFEIGAESATSSMEEKKVINDATNPHLPILLEYSNQNSLFLSK